MTLRRLFLASVLAVIAPISAHAQDTMEIPPEIMEAIQGDISNIHTEIMQATIQLPAGQAGTFWTLYDEYLAEVRGLTAERTELVRDFAMAFEGMADDQATELGRRALELESRRIELTADYFDRISDALGGVVAGQFLQIETRINTLKDLRLELELPIIGG